LAARRQKGEKPQRREYADRFPDDAELIDAIFAEDELATEPPAIPGESTVRDPSKIARYTILRRLGRGSFGQVYLAHDEDLDRRVAIKVPIPDRVSRPEDIEAYLTEARILGGLDHPHIVPVFDVGRTDDGLCFVVYKLIEGSDLASKITESRPHFHESA